MTKRKRYASSTDVARLAGVSQSAVSRAYKPGASVSPATRSKILAAAATLNYRPSLIPRIMLTNRSNLVAVVIGGMYNPFNAAVLEQFTIGLEQQGHQALLVHADSGYMLDEAIPRLASYRVDAIMSPLAVLSSDADAEFRQLHIPIISFNTPVRSEWVSTVCCDNEAAGREVVDLFVEGGARRFGFVCGPEDSPAAEERLQGFRKRLQELGLPAPRIARGDFRYEGGLEAAHALLRMRLRPDAVFCANDLLALGVIDVARRDFGIRVPEDLMVAGFDDIPAASWKAYDLTTFVQDAEAMTQQALEILRRALAQHDHQSERIVLPARLIERGTTRSAGGSRSNLNTPDLSVRTRATVLHRTPR
jgi:DNA-binding LacI/PurR family transcriptional regulator